MKLLHIALNDVAVRAHLSFTDADRVEHYYLLPSDSQNISVFDDTRVTIFHPENYDFIMKQVSLIKPDAILISDRLKNQGFKKSLQKSCKFIYFIQHGLWNPHNINELLLSKDFITNYSGLKKVFVGYRNYQLLKHLPINLSPVNGTTQIDYMLKTYQEGGARDKKSIIFVSNHKGSKTSVDEYFEIIGLLKKFSEEYNYNIYSKIKRPQKYKIGIEANNKSNKELNQLHNHPNLIVVADDSLIYKYFNVCDIVVIQTCGTTLIESFIINKPTILCQLHNFTDYMDVKKYTKIPQANDIQSLWDQLLGHHNNNIITNPEYQRERMKFIEENVGNVVNSSQQIVDAIVNDLSF